MLHQKKIGRKICTLPEASMICLNSVKIFMSCYAHSTQAYFSQNPRSVKLLALHTCRSVLKLSGFEVQKLASGLAKPLTMHV